MPPQIDGSLEIGRRLVGPADLAAFADRLVGRADDLEHLASILARFHRRLEPLDTANEMRHLLWEAVIPDFFEHGEGVALCRGGLLDRVAVPRLAVGQQR